MSINSNEWKHPQTGETRHYINNWVELVGFEVQRYNTGNICHVTLDGAKISNALARDTFAAKVWYNNDGQIFVQHRGRTCMLPDTIIERLQPLVDAEIEEMRAIEAEKQAEKEAEENLPVGEIIVTEELNEDSWHGVMNTGEKILYITVTATRTRQHVYIYDSKPQEYNIYRHRVAHKSNKYYYEGKELHDFIREVIATIK